MLDEPLECNSAQDLHGHMQREDSSTRNGTLTTESNAAVESVLRESPFDLCTRSRVTMLDAT